MSRNPVKVDRKQRSWSVRQHCGRIRELASLSDLAELILEGQLDPRTEISAGNGHWKRLDDVVDRQAFCQTLRALGHFEG